MARFHTEILTRKVGTSKGRAVRGRNGIVTLLFLHKQKLFRLICIEGYHTHMTEGWGGGGEGEGGEKENNIKQQNNEKERKEKRGCFRPTKRKGCAFRNSRIAKL